MTQDEAWQAKYDEVVAFIEKYRRNPSKYDAEERGRYGNWLKHNRKVYNAGGLREERREKFKVLIELCERYKRVFST